MIGDPLGPVVAAFGGLSGLGGLSGFTQQRRSASLADQLRRQQMSGFAQQRLQQMSAQTGLGGGCSLEAFSAFVRATKPKGSCARPCSYCEKRAGRDSRGRCKECGAAK